MSDLWQTLGSPRPNQPARLKLLGSISYQGGPQTKSSQLDAICELEGHPYDTVICLSALKAPLWFLWLLKKRGARVLLNQNGVYYPLWWPSDWARKNQYFLRVSKLANHVFFQSIFAKQAFADWVGPAPQHSSILYNAVDRSLFRPDWARASNPSSLRVLIFLDFHARYKPLWAYFAHLSKELTSSKVILVGRILDNETLQQAKADFAGVDVEWHLNLDKDDVSSVLRNCDLALHFVYNDVCPNKVLECLASGVFVLCSSAGGAKELVGEGGGMTFVVPEGYVESSYPKFSEVVQAIERLRPEISNLRREAFAASAKFDLGAWVAANLGLFSSRK